MEMLPGFELGFLINRELYALWLLALKISVLPTKIATTAVHFNIVRADTTVW